MLFLIDGVDRTVKIAKHISYTFCGYPDGLLETSKYQPIVKISHCIWGDSSKEQNVINHNCLD